MPNISIKYIARFFNIPELVITKSSNKPGIWISRKIGYTAPGFFHIPGMVITTLYLVAAVVARSTTLLMKKVC